LFVFVHVIKHYRNNKIKEHGVDDAWEGRYVYTKL